MDRFTSARRECFAAVDERAGSREPERAFERVVRRFGDENGVRLGQVAAEASGAPLEVAPRPAARELLEEVLDQVLLRELLDDLHLLETDGDLARDGAAELDANASFGDEQPDQLVVGN